MKKPYLFLLSPFRFISHLVSIFSQISSKKNKTTRHQCESILYLIIVVFASQNLISQNIPGGATCVNASPLCYESGSSYIFENVTKGSAGSGIACLADTPGPAWFYFKIDNAGTLEFEISQGEDNDNNGQIDPGSGIDVDFVAWGPFSSPTGNCGNLDNQCVPGDQSAVINGCPDNDINPNYYSTDTSNIVDCSFSIQSTEIMTINNAQSGEYYLLLITNFALVSGIIVFTQTNENEVGSGSTDCEIINIDGILGPDQDVCEPNDVILNANPNNDNSFIDFMWEVDTGSGFNPIPNTNGQSQITVSTSGEYRVTITDNNNDIDSDIILITINPLPIGTNYFENTCSNKTLNIDLTTLTNISSSYSWVATDNPNVSGETTTISTNNIIADTLVNKSGMDQNVIYTITPQHSNNSDCVGEDFTVTVTVYSEPVFDSISAVCEGTDIALPTTSNNGISGTWAPSFNNTQSTTYTFTPTTGPCNTPATLRVDITKKTLPTFDPIAAVCEGTEITLPTTSKNGITGTWSPAFDNTQSTTYTFTPTSGQCAIPTTLRVDVLSPKNLTISALNLSKSFKTEQKIEVSVEGGNGNYQYQLDNGHWQASPIFRNVVGCEEHIVRVRELEGCNYRGKTSITIYDYPKYFSPNGDGYNDYWTISCLKNKNATITIFDRFGKFLSKFDVDRQGWDGSWNGTLMPTNDYWFIATYFEDGVKKQFKSHFSLKR